MGRTLAHQCLGAALIAMSCLMLAASVQAGQTKPNVVRIAKPQTSFGSGFTFGQPFRPHRFKPRRFDERDLRPSFVTFRHHRHRHRHVPIYYYDYDRDYGYRDEPRYQPDYRPEAIVAPAAKPYGPVTPKWVHVGGEGTTSPTGAEEAYPEAGPGANCLAVKTEITVDGAPMDAFGKACLLADGTWQLRPAEVND